MRMIDSGTLETEECTEIVSMSYRHFMNCHSFCGLFKVVIGGIRAMKPAVRWDLHV